MDNAFRAAMHRHAKIMGMVMVIDYWYGMPSRTPGSNEPEEFPNIRDHIHAGTETQAERDFVYKLEVRADRHFEALEEDNGENA